MVKSRRRRETSGTLALLANPRRKGNNVSSDEEAAVGLAPGMEEIRPTDEPASAARQPHATETVVTSSFRNAGEGEPAEGENAINGATNVGPNAVSAQSTSYGFDRRRNEYRVSRTEDSGMGADYLRSTFNLPPF